MKIEKEAILDDYAFLVSQTDKKGIIQFANDDFCKVSEYTIDELIGQPHSIVRHSDMPKKAFQSLWDTVKSGKVWTGYVKNTTKSGGFYWVFATVYPSSADNGDINYLSCKRKANIKEISEAIKLYNKWHNEN